MRVLWVSNRIFNNIPDKQSGVWLKTLAHSLVIDFNIELANISIKAGLEEVEHTNWNSIDQWAFPTFKVNNNGIPSAETVQKFNNIVESYRPDIIHVWGTENAFRLLPFKTNFKCQVVLSMQGVLASIPSVMYNGLSYYDLFRTIGVQEILRHGSIYHQKRQFLRDSKIESQILKNVKHIIIQSNWVRSQLLSYSREHKIYENRVILRPEFSECMSWVNFTHSSKIIFSSSVGYSYKGLHILIKALSIVKEFVPEIQLRLAGNIGRRDFLGNGYLRYIIRLIKKNNLEENVNWLGAIDGDQVIRNLQECDVFVNSSYVESYSVSTAEALAVGTPSVIAFSGAMPELAKNEIEALYFTPGDYRQCASMILRLIRNKEYATFISNNILRNSNFKNQESIVKTQIDIYKIIINSTE